jgi:hypothetical protein
VLPGQISPDAPDTGARPAEGGNGVSAMATIVPVTVEPLEHLSPDEVQTLEHYEEIIAQGLQTFVHVGHALLVIRDQRLYRQAYGTFEEYLRQRWDLGRSYAHRMIDAAVVVENLLPIGNMVPVNEAQARPLTTLPPEQQQEVWKEAVETAPPSGVTAKHVQQTVTRVKARPSAPKASAPHLSPTDRQVAHVVDSLMRHAWMWPEKHWQAFRSVIDNLERTREQNNHPLRRHDSSGEERQRWRTETRSPVDALIERPVDPPPSMPMP